jgi:hypothetical protein
MIELHELLGDDGLVEPRREGKFVLLRLHGQRHLCLAPRGVASFHAQIVERFCAARGLACRSVPAQERPEVAPELEVEGGGRYDLDEVGRALRLFGASVAYGPFPRDGLRDLLAASPRLAGYTLLVEPS